MAAPINELSVQGEFTVEDLKLDEGVDIGLERLQGDMIQLQRQRGLQGIETQRPLAFERALLIEPETGRHRHRTLKRHLQVVHRQMQIVEREFNRRCKTAILKSHLGVCDLHRLHGHLPRLPCFCSRRFRLWRTFRRDGNRRKERLKVDRLILSKPGANLGAGQGYSADSQLALRQVHADAIDPERRHGQHRLSTPCFRQPEIRQLHFAL